MGESNLILDWTNYFIGTGILLTTITVLWLQLNKQSKVSSATLVLELLKPWRTKETQELFQKINNKTITSADEQEIGYLLNQLEDIAVLEKDKTLDSIHVKEFFGTDLKSIRDNDVIKEYIESYAKLNPDYYFVNLRNLLKKVDSWKI